MKYPLNFTLTQRFSPDLHDGRAHAVHTNMRRNCELHHDSLIYGTSHIDISAVQLVQSLNSFSPNIICLVVS